MARKKSIRKAAESFCENAEKITKYGEAAWQHNPSKEYVSWAYDYAIIKLYREFESLMFDALVGAINNDTRTLADSTGHNFPQHLTEEVCRFLISGTGYFDFKGRSGLISTLRKFVPSDHYLGVTVKSLRQ